MRTRAEMKQAAKAALKGHWADAVLFVLMFLVIIMVISYLAQPEVELQTVAGQQVQYEYSSPMNNLAQVVSVLVSPALGYALLRYFYRLSLKQKVNYGMILDGFKRFLPLLALYWRMVIQTFLWTLLLIIPGIIAGFRYSMAFYILSDEKDDTGENPWTRAGRILKESGALMDGYKWDYFVLNLSFIGWAILALLPFGLGLLWLVPYMQTTYGNFYQDLKGRFGVKKIAAKVAVKMKRK